MDYKYSVCVILRDGFIDTDNSFLSQNNKSFKSFEKYLAVYIFKDEGLAKLIQNFKIDTRSRAGLHLDCQDYNLPTQIEKIIITRERFESRFMTEFVGGKFSSEKSDDLMSELETKVEVGKLEFSAEAQAVFDAGRELWKYYFTQISQNPTENVSKNPSLYDIKAYFQGVDESGRMNNKSEDEKYNLLITNLRQGLEVLSFKIQPKVYEFGFLR